MDYAWIAHGLVVESQGIRLCVKRGSFLLTTTWQILPWDTDIDVQMTIETLSFLANFYNMSVYHFHIPRQPNGRDYLLEINPKFTDTEPDKWNMIDARWIDIDTGLFIDITAVKPNETARAMGVEGVLMCKDRHRYLVCKRQR